MKFLKIYSIIIISFTVATLMIWLYWSLYPYKTLVINKPIKTTELVYKPEDVLTYTLDYCKYTNKEASISRSFIDGVILTMPLIKANNQKGCRVSNISLIVPNLPSGKYKLRNDYFYQVNPIRTEVVQEFSNFFEVVNGGINVSK